MSEIVRKRCKTQWHLRMIDYKVTNWVTIGNIKNEYFRVIGTVINVKEGVYISCLKNQVSFSDCLSSVVCPSSCKLVIFSSSLPEPLMVATFHQS